jgi:hypothetical protein
LTDEDLHKILLAGQTFNDQVRGGLVLDMGFGFQPVQGRWPHGPLIHRLQLHLVLRDLVLNAKNYGSPSSVLHLYRQMGNPDLLARLDWSKTGLDSPSRNHTLFFQLFDSPENNGSSPGFFNEYKEYWPNLVSL